MSIAAQSLRKRGGHDPRIAALLVLNAVIFLGQDSQSALDQQLRSANLVPSDKALCTELVYGVLRRYLGLDWFLRRKLAQPDKLPPEMLLTLILAAYELAHTRIGPHASLDFAVRHVKARFGVGLSKVANGVLRVFQRGLQSEYLNPEFYRSVLPDEAEALAVRFAVPTWLTRLWRESYGPESALDYLEAASRPATLGLRLNLAYAGWQELRAELLKQEGALPVGRATLAMRNGKGLPLAAWQKEGRLSRASAAAYEALWALRPSTWASPLWDACAGRGNKTLSLLESGLPVTLCTDPARHRLSALPAELERLGLTAQAPELQFRRAEEAALSGRFATILLDVPCSGLGTLAHRPEIRLRRSPADFPALCAVQDSLLEAAHAALIPGGNLIYLTCTLNPAENQQRIANFLVRHPNASQHRTWATPSTSPLGEFFWSTWLKV